MSWDSFSPVFLPQVMQEIVIKEGMVYDILRNLNVNKSVGPDGIHPKFLKELSN